MKGTSSIAPSYQWPDFSREQIEYLRGGQDTQIDSEALPAPRVIKPRKAARGALRRAPGAGKKASDG
jgi:hypothetical protein